MNKHVLIATIVTGVAILFSGTVYADELDLRISPRSLGVIAKPGSSIRIPLSIVNTGDSQYIRPMMVRSLSNEEHATIEYRTIESLPLRVSFFEGEDRVDGSVLINKKRSKNIVAQLEVGETIPVGDYTLAVGVETQPEYASSPYDMRVKLRLLSPILLTISRNGLVDVQGTIKSFAITGHRYFFDSFESVPLDLVIANTGKNATRVGGKVVVRNMFGQHAEYDLVEQLVPTKSQRSMRLAADPMNIPSLKGFFVGTYNVSAQITLSDGVVQLTQSTKFYSFPYGIVTVGMLVTIGGLILLRKRR